MQPEIAPIQVFIGSCIDQTATEALTILGMNGGYIDFPLSIESNPRSYLQSGPLDEIKNPYWWYDGISAIPPPNGRLRTRKYKNKVNASSARSAPAETADSKTAFEKLFSASR